MLKASTMNTCMVLWRTAKSDGLEELALHARQEIKRHKSLLGIPFLANAKKCIPVIHLRPSCLVGQVLHADINSVLLKIPF